MTDRDKQERILDDLYEYLVRACNFRVENGKPRWTCDRTRTHINRWMCFRKIKRIPVPTYYCDCEVVLNIDVLKEALAPQLFIVPKAPFREVSLWDEVQA